MAQWTKGQSGNAGGRPREIGDLRERARKRTEEALDTLTAIMLDPEAPAAARVAAANSMLDRGYGRASQQVEHSGEIVEVVEYSVIDSARKVAFLLAEAASKLDHQKT